jgi:hypothetical protein
MDKPLPRFTSKSTKEEILKAYNDLLGRYQEKSLSVPEKKAETIRKASDAAVVEKASTYTVEFIIKGMADLSLNLGKALTDLASQLTSEANKLTELREAIAIQTRSLEELHDIRVAADTLALLIQEHEERKTAFAKEKEETQEEFTEEMATRRLEWKKEQDAYTAVLKENEARLKKEREREKEEYEYSLAQARKKDKDTYEAQKTALLKQLAETKETQEKEFAVREAAVTAQETELTELRKKVAAFPAELTVAVEKAEKEATVRAENRAKVEAQLLAKAVEGDKRVADLKIKALEETVAKQSVQIEGITRQLNEANTQVQAIAVKAIEGASGAKALSAINEIAIEQAKNLRGKM